MKLIFLILCFLAMVHFQFDIFIWHWGCLSSYSLFWCNISTTVVHRGPRCDSAPLCYMIYILMSACVHMNMCLHTDIVQEPTTKSLQSEQARYTKDISIAPVYRLGNRTVLLKVQQKFCSRDENRT